MRWLCAKGRAWCGVPPARSGLAAADGRPVLVVAIVNTAEVDAAPIVAVTALPEQSPQRTASRALAETVNGLALFGGDGGVATLQPAQPADLRMWVQGGRLEQITAAGAHTSVQLPGLSECSLQPSSRSGIVESDVLPIDSDCSDCS